MIRVIANHAPGMREWWAAAERTFPRPLIVRRFLDGEKEIFVTDRVANFLREWAVGLPGWAIGTEHPLVFKKFFGEVPVEA